MIVADNWRFLKTDNARQSKKSKQIMWMFIPPYWPEIKSCEKLINYIKVCVKTLVSKQSKKQTLNDIELFSWGKLRV